MVITAFLILSLVTCMVQGVLKGCIVIMEIATLSVIQMVALLVKMDLNVQKLVME
jgi:hypothetical protein